MMFKKEYLILAAVIIGACLYLYLKDRDRVNYRLPELAPLEKAAIAGIEIRRPGAEMAALKKADGNWLLAPADYPADEAQVKEMLEALSGLTLTALVSDSEDYDRYDLSDEKAILVTARSGDQTKTRELMVGKRAASYHHTFVRLGGDPRVYHAGGSLHDIFDKSADALRDKTVLSFEKEEIDRIAIAMAGETLQLDKQPLAKDVPDAGASGEGPAPDVKKKIWKAAGGQAVDQSGVEELLNTLSSLKCGSYLPEEAEKKLADPDYLITLTGTKEYTLSLFPLPEEERNDYAGISSENPSVFSLPDYQAGRIMKKPSELLTGAAR